LQPRFWFIVDAQLPPRLARQLTDAGYPAMHIIERLPPAATDRQIADLANELGAYVVSKDEDFAELVARKILRTGVVWVRIGNADQHKLWRAIHDDLPRLIDLLADGRSVIELPLPQ